MLRTKFYTVWKLAEGACILSGLGYIGYDPKTLKPDFSRVQNIVIRNVELPENPRMMMNNWNMNTQKWLRNHVYLRLINSNQTNSAFVTLVTFMVSALWHGFHPGYYISFLFVSFYIMCGRLLRKHVRPFVVSGKLSGLKQVFIL